MHEKEWTPTAEELEARFAREMESESVLCAMRDDAWEHAWGRQRDVD